MSETIKKRVPTKQAGDSLRDRRDDILFDSVLVSVLYPILIFLFAGYNWFLCLSGYRPNIPACIGMTIGLIVVMVWSVPTFKKAKRDIKHIKQGIEGEVYVGTILERFRSRGAEVYHDIEGESFNIDHLLVSRRGIFLIETKNWSKKDGDTKQIEYDGKEIRANGFRSDRIIQNINGYEKWLQNLFTELTGKDNWKIHKVVLFPGWYINSHNAMLGTDTWVLNEKAFMTCYDNRKETVEDTDHRLLVKCLNDYLRMKS